MTTTITPLRYSLTSGVEGNVQEKPFKSANGDFPLQDLDEESDDHFVARTYLQFLWLPESMMPLELLVPSLLRIRSPPSSSTPHPLHNLLEPLLLTARSTSNKYHVELPRILEDGGGAGEMEEMMMWFAVNHEKGPDQETRPDASVHGEGPWANEAWRKSWLERMERREVQIQILLYMLKLSLPGPAPSLETYSLQSPTSPVQRKRQKKQSKPFVPTVEDRLESFMDKLSMWQLVHGVESKEDNAASDARDWMQTFCEEIVEPEFKRKLPDKCSLLRSKVFPDTPFSDDESRGGSSRSTSPNVDPKMAKARKKSATKKPSLYRKASSSTLPGQRHRERSRSRSLSISLAEEADARRARSMSADANKRLFNREVSMSRVFKPKGKDRAKASSLENKAGSRAVRQQRPKSPALEEVVLVDATPTRKIKGVSRAIRERGAFGAAQGTRTGEEQDGGEEMWDIPSSPDILLLGDENEDVYQTPTKKGKSKR